MPVFWIGVGRRETPNRSVTDGVQRVAVLLRREEVVDVGDALVDQPGDAVVAQVADQRGEQLQHQRGRHGGVHDEAADRFVPSAAFAAVDTCAVKVVFAASGSVGVSVAVLEPAS